MGLFISRCYIEFTNKIRLASQTKNTEDVPVEQDIFNDDTELIGVTSSHEFPYKRPIKH